MKFVLLIFNIKSNTNIGQLIRTANAFGAEEICIIGRKKFSTYGNQRTASTTKFRRVYQIDEAITQYKNLNYDFVGIEITDESVSINEKDFENNTVFILGNEGTGIHEHILTKCDYCVYIPQFGSGASINVNTACGIVFNVFTKNRKNPNRIDGFKFENVSK
ncbi:MAG: 23S rRNA (guanosine2251-2'-O)-methyltransferase [Granulosicoccus sp.]|jgi:tRNA G18 (ribose-2'-O)-methylase SpoU